MVTRKIHALTATGISKTRKVGYHADGGGLYLQVAPTGAKTWIFRYTRRSGEGKGKRREMGLGGLDALTLAQAREKAATCRHQVLNGIDPIAARAKAPMSDMTLTAVLRRIERADITVHGFRSTFRDWAAECTNYPNHVVEMALAHAIGDAVEAAYRRGDLFQKRRDLMQAWADYCEERTAVVIPMKGAKRRYRVA